MKVVLSTSPHIKHSAVLEADFRPRNDLMYTFAPLGLLSLAAVIREKLHFTPTIYDINSCINNNEIHNSNSFYYSAATSVLKHDPDVLGFMTECDSYHHVLQVCAKVKALKPSCYIILGGPHATAVAMETLNKWNCIDCIVLGEGEMSFAELISNRLSNRHEIVPGTVMRNENGIAVKGTKNQLVESLDELPFPAYDLYTPLQGEELFIEVGRGCPFQCTFCSTSPFWHRQHRVKSPARIVAEAKYICNLHKVQRIHFTHDLFTTNQIWVRNVCEALIDAGLGINWTCSSRTDTISEELIELMSRAGCNAIFFGIESGSDRVLEIIEKKIPFSKTCGIIALCHKYGITPNAGLIVGFPFEDQQSFTDTFNAYLHLLKSGIKPLHIFSYCPFVQSSLYESLTTLESSENFLDIPLPEPLNTQNRLLIAKDKELFASYYKPRLSSIPNLEKGMLYAVDEFALLVDAVRLPSIAAADAVGSMDILFFEWVDYILDANTANKKAAFRKFFGQPTEFCSFLKRVCKQFTTAIPPYIPSLLDVIHKNLVISAESDTSVPTTMATYRSRTFHKDLTTVRYESRISGNNIVHLMQLDYNIIPLLNASMMPLAGEINRGKINLVWQMNNTGTVSLLQVNDFIYQLVKKAHKGEFSVREMIDDWQRDDLASTLPLPHIFAELQTASHNNIIKIK